ncbi:MAG TPA: hypothetical protein DGG94_20830, partial [Micromonosporaceae bacterium]|nr:hypothetical protein [Micromonosporaceae bacterium]
THTEILPVLAEIGHDLRPLGDLGYEGEAATITVAFKRPKNGRLTDTAALGVTDVQFIGGEAPKSSARPTHHYSPPCPEPKSFEVSGHGIQPVKWEDLEIVGHWRHFLKQPRRLPPSPQRRTIGRGPDAPVHRTIGQPCTRVPTLTLSA